MQIGVDKDISHTWDSKVFYDEEITLIYLSGKHLWKVHFGRQVPRQHVIFFVVFQKR